MNTSVYVYHNSLILDNRQVENYFGINLAHTFKITIPFSLLHNSFSSTQLSDISKSHIWSGSSFCCTISRQKTRIEKLWHNIFEKKVKAVWFLTQKTFWMHGSIAIINSIAQTHYSMHLLRQRKKKNARGGAFLLRISVLYKSNVHFIFSVLAL